MSFIEQNKETILKKVAELKERFNFTIPYWILDILLTNKAEKFIQLYPQEYLNICSWLIYAEYICHLIPFPKAFNSDNTGKLRTPEKCLSSLMLFYHTHSDEEAIIKYSNSLNSKLPKLKFADDSHDVFHWGAGTRQADFCEIDNQYHRFEAKFNYAAKGSISSNHNADEVLDCLPGGGVDWYHFCAGQNMGKLKDKCISKEELLFIDRDQHKVPPMLKEDDLEYLQSGTILLELDKIFNISIIPAK